MDKIILSICIPTHNRKNTLKETLNSIIPQIQSGVEIVINDNGSTDNTLDMLKKYKKRYKFIRFGRFEKNMGADINFLRVAELAKGKYLWLFSSDDIMENGAIKRILTEIKENPEIDIYHLNLRVYNSRCEKEILSTSNCIHKKDEKVTNFKYFMNNDIRIIYSGYLGALVIKKKVWEKYSNEAKKFINTAYVHTYILWKAIKNGAKVKVISQPYIKYRYAYDSFTDYKEPLGYRTLKRMMLDVIGYDIISAEVFGKNSEINKKVKLAVIRYSILPHIVHSKMKRIKFDDCVKIFKALYPYYKDYLKFWFVVLPALLVPNFLVKFIYKTRKKILQMCGQKGIIIEYD